MESRRLTVTPLFFSKRGLALQYRDHCIKGSETNFAEIYTEQADTVVEQSSEVGNTSNWDQGSPVSSVLANWHSLRNLFSAAGQLSCRFQFHAGSDSAIIITLYNLVNFARHLFDRMKFCWFCQTD